MNFEADDLLARVDQWKLELYDNLEAMTAEQRALLERNDTGSTCIRSSRGQSRQIAYASNSAHRRCARLTWMDGRASDRDTGRIGIVRMGNVMRSSVDG